MQFFLLVLFICFFFFLFCLHYLAKEDFVFIRKNVSLEQLFNAAFLTGFAALFFARLFYVLYHPSLKFLNPLMFFGLPYFPGLSLSGGLIGALIFLLLYGRKRRLPTARMGDFFSIGFLLVVPAGFLISGLLGTKNDLLLFLIASGITWILFIFFMKFLFPKLIGSQFKDGTIMYLFLMNFPLVFLLSQIISRAILRQFYFTPEDGVLLAIFLFGVIFYMRQESSRSRKKILK